jgi:hypothetical protein
LSGAATAESDARFDGLVPGVWVVSETVDTLTGGPVALSERARSNIYTGLSNVIDQEAVAEMLSHFPARDVDEAVTKEHLDTQIALIRSELHIEMSALRNEIKDDLNTLRNEIKDDLHATRTAAATARDRLRADLTTAISRLQTDTTTAISGLQTDTTTAISGLRGDVENALRQQLYWLVGTMITLFAICTTLILTVR